MNSGTPSWNVGRVLLCTQISFYHTDSTNSNYSSLRSASVKEQLLGVHLFTQVRVVAPLPPMIPGYALAWLDLRYPVLGVVWRVCRCMLKSECQADVFARHLTVRGYIQRS